MEAATTIATATTTTTAEGGYTAATKTTTLGYATTTTVANTTDPLQYRKDESDHDGVAALAGKLSASAIVVVAMGLIARIL
jgi:hypothetical protein